MTLGNWQKLLSATNPGCLELANSLACNMAASDSESSLSGADVTIIAVHPSLFREPTTGDEFDGQEISFEAPESRDIQAFLDWQRSLTTPVSSSSDAEVPEITLPASSTDFQDPRPARKRQQRRVPPVSKAPGSTGWKWAVLWKGSRAST